MTDIDMKELARIIKDQCIESDDDLPLLFRAARAYLAQQKAMPDDAREALGRITGQLINYGDSFDADILTIIAALQNAQGVPDGYKMVPFKNPVTSDMKSACIGEFSYTTEEPDLRDHGEYYGETYSRENVVPWDTCKQIYKAMLAAAPELKEVC